MVLNAGRKGGTKRPEKCFKRRCGTVIGYDGPSVCMSESFLLYCCTCEDQMSGTIRESITSEDTFRVPKTSLKYCNVKSDCRESASAEAKWLILHHYLYFIGQYDTVVVVCMPFDIFKSIHYLAWSHRERKTKVDTHTNGEAEVVQVQFR